jgi:hypothetical protein
MVRVGKSTRRLGGQVTTGAGTSEREVGPTITAMLDDGPLRGTQIKAQVVQGRPPSTVDVQADDEGMCRYCLTEWTQSGPSAVYTFLYRV